MPDIRLAALDDFRCLGSDCPANCCEHPWRIDVDAGTYERWLALPPSAERERLLASVRREEQDGRTRLRFVADAAGRCPHLNGERMCSLQLAHGHEFLPRTCRVYPRITTASETATTSSAQLSCPEVARLVLFSRREEPALRETGYDPRHPSAGSDPVPHCLHGLITQALRASKFPLGTRLVFIARQLVRLAALSEQGRLTQQALNDMLRGTATGLYDTNVALRNGQLRPAPLAAGWFWYSAYQLNKALFDADERFRTHASGLYAALTDASAGTEESYEPIHSAVRQCREQAGTALEPYASAFERYLAATFANHGFPWQPVAGNYVSSFIDAVFPLATARLLLWAQVTPGRRVSEKDIVSAVYRAERSLSHNSRVCTVFDRNPQFLWLDHYYPVFGELL